MKSTLTLGFVLGVASVLAAPQDYRTTPVPILKQINRQNDDGSYSFGYEAADGTFKIETKYPNGEVHGKYGYVGDDGKLREIEYGASKRGFEPSGTGINVAPPTLSNSIDNTNPKDYDDGQYREDPSIYYKKSSTATSTGSGNALASNTRFPASTTNYQNPQPVQYYQPAQNYQAQNYQAQNYQAQNYQAQYYQPQPQFRPQPNYFNPQPQFITYDPAIFNGHPAANFDINTGSYTISYAG